MVQGKTSRQQLCPICKKRPLWIRKKSEKATTRKRCYHKHVWPERPAARRERLDFKNQTQVACESEAFDLSSHDEENDVFPFDANAYYWQHIRPQEDREIQPKVNLTAGVPHYKCPFCAIKVTEPQKIQHLQEVHQRKSQGLTRSQVAWVLGVAETKIPSALAECDRRGVGKGRRGVSYPNTRLWSLKRVLEIAEEEIF